MSTVTPLAASLDQRLRRAMAAVLPTGAADADPIVRPSDHADFQANGALALAKRLGTNPRELAARIATSVANDELIASCEVSGPGFLNVTLTDAAILNQVALRSGDARAGLRPGNPGRVTVVDYSQPNIAKEMHVGHLRSTIIGDALVRILEFDGSKVVRQNHLGDWGTQFGMLIQYLLEHTDDQAAPDRAESGSEAISRLNALYRTARSKFDSDSEFAERARARVVELQAGDATTLASWQRIVAESKVYFNEVYDRLGVLLDDADAVGESFYNPMLQDIAKDLETRGVAQRSDGALCVFFDGVNGPDGNPTPLIIQKSDGGFGYAATDLAAIRHRVGTLGASRLLYVVDSRQALHFRMVFETARRAGYLPDSVEAVHVSFGSVLGPDGRPFKTRAGDTVRLISLLDEALDRARITVQEKNQSLVGELLDQRAREVGIGAVKYADLSTGRARDYVFDIDRMVSLNGNTGVYLQYAHARIHSILRKASAADLAASIDTTGALEPAERRLAMLLDELAPAIVSVTDTLEPHRLCGYLYSLAQAFTDFYEACPVLRAPTDEVRANRVILCRLTGDTLKIGLALLGIEAPDEL
ncbi:arginine--tRNA ligase [Actinoplanes sichuanensis]|uniref:Arginine--tRNA ligase n=1 Tax=Actinoplanes sichuanensis TaxID=512349 RepID=A0ABW4ARB8_9ACTN|nr:arginine--tRNA ligase [Actinoplanes sichuanensis]BEL07203.1 arginine--tRNA ligase [Actinoplanes sichuanensis]